MDKKARTFEDKPASREQVGLMIGEMGPSGSGKTMSALRLATGIQKITGGEIYGIDTESRRMLHYADYFKFRHIAFTAPFSPLDYLAAIEHCVSKGGRIIIVDSMSHEHEGPGGVLEMHEAELRRMATDEQGRYDYKKADRINMLAWAKPKAERRRLLNSIMQLDIDAAIFCFRAKEKIKITKGEKEPEELGWMPIAGEEFLYEMTVNFLLPPNSNGVPQWKAHHRGEQAMIKLPEQFRRFFDTSKSLDESIGEELAKWAAGKAKPQSKPANGTIGKLVAAFEELGINRTMIESRMEKSLDVATDIEIKNLRKIYAEIKAGHQQWT